MHCIRLCSTWMHSWVKLLLVLAIWFYLNVDADECIASKTDRHRTIMEAYRSSHNWNAILTEDSLNLHENQTDLDLSKQGFHEVHWHLSSIVGEGYDIYELDMSYNNIEVLNELTFLKFYSLEMLNLSYNRIMVINNLTFGSLIRLMELDLSFNLIHTIEKEAFNRMYALESLNLRENCLITLNEHQFHFNDHLSSLLLNHNQIGFLPSVLFDSLAMVEELFEVDLSYNNFHRMPYIEAKEIGLLKVDYNQINILSVNRTYNVRALEAHHNNIHDADLFQFSSAEHVDLSHNQLDNIAGLHEMTRLEYLDLSSNNISRFDYNLKYSIRNIPTLATLRLQNCSLTENNMDGLLISESILNLDLSQNNFVRLNISHLAKLKTLQYVSLNFNYLQELIDYEHMAHHFPHLELISLSFNRWNCSYFDNIISYLNKTHIQTTTDPRDCYINGTHITDSDITDSFEPEYTLNQVKRDMNLVKNLGRSMTYFMYALYYNMHGLSNHTHFLLKQNDQKMAAMSAEIGHLVGMVAFMVTIFGAAMVLAVAYGLHILYKRWQMNRSVKVVTYNKRANEFSNGVTVNEVMSDNI
ncbi:toll-like receptor 13 isoform X2 [Aedes albopictus]|uniref:Membrane glycoprotein lig-1 n=1 Tax=Aedes albopictus TaxID=7160 RepID=A0ABM1YIW0_AEDAL|nr:toll-like receptor 13 [Aedes albopictus]XP_019545139.2 toll-like receptor 13 [Aedes albopictus]XP_019545140.2 toll-like receptor 13 [Aedes albopictus]XP_019545143.2 toll-like receptor 13 [Aedes albopictus]XP_029727638.1 toll-like receptor 13 [Aedes albopictus]XP_029727644.1 toll-like receptor 13 [Aedes albopictus]XP_029727647.1 toll-like receptor 13 [Aedes albopictus]